MILLPQPPNVRIIGMHHHTQLAGYHFLKVDCNIIPTIIKLYLVLFFLFKSYINSTGTFIIMYFFTYTLK
jgi:hypothetical protein